MIQAASPLLTVLLAHLAFADERLTWQRGAGVVVGLVGTLMLIGPKMFDGGAEAPAALAMLALASC
jgi:drug/metabolite transporter (DMT)-like permease